jgi:8-oxo-dGTP pyrophosphatase MutT (NUDIX family)
VPGGGIENGESKLQAVKREVQEEVGIDITNAHIEALGKSTGQIEKVLQDTGERVLVEMTFYDFKVNLPQNAKDVSLTFGDDLGEAKWFSITELPQITLGEAVKSILQRMGYVSQGS